MIESGVGNLEVSLLTKLKACALEVRRDVVRMVGVARAGHMNSSLSVVDILVWLYGSVLAIRPDEPQWPLRDRFILSKATASPALYAVLAERGFFGREELWGYRRLGSTMQAFADFKRAPGIDASCGSLGMGPGVSLGLALALRDRALRDEARVPQVFCLVGDGELQEGAVWESLLAGAHHNPGNLTVIVDRNGFQLGGGTEDIAALEPLKEKFASFGWKVACADGHDFEALDNAFAVLPADAARVIIAHTTRGKGISSLENASSAAGVVLGAQTTDKLLKELEDEHDGKKPQGSL